MLIKSLKRVFVTAMLSCIAITAFAEDAPVYDVDNYPPQFDGQPIDGSAGGQPQAQSQVPVTSQSAPPPKQYAPSQSTQSLQSLPLDQRVGRVEQQMTNLQRSDSTAKVNDLQNEVQSLRGQVESLTHQLQQMQSQQRSMYSDLDKRLNKQQSVASPPVATQQASPDEDLPAPPKTLKPKQKASASKSKSVSVAEDSANDQAAAISDTSDAASLTPDDSGATKSNPKPETASSASSEQEELQMYQSAYDLIKDSKFDQAIGVLQNMLKKYPAGQSAANAHYWLGELYGLQKKKDQAAVEFASVVKNYPDSPKVSDAQVKLGMIYAAQLKWPEAKNTFKQVIARYPGTTSARLAAQQLKEIKTEGH